jgi:ribonuclease P/MRP protein subunit RPP1
MNTTDASVCPYPAGNSTLERMALEARDLGFDSLIAIETGGGATAGLEILCGTVIDAGSIKEVLRQVRQPSVRRADVVFVNAGDLAFNRAVVSLREVHVIRNLHAAHRNAFDHVAARTAGERGVAVDISLIPLIQSRGARRQRALQHYADLLTLQRRYRFPLTISSGARSVLEQRSVREIRQLCSLFGMTQSEVGDALGSVGGLIEPEERLRVIE